MAVVNRSEVYLVNVDPTIGREIKKLGRLDREKMATVLTVLSEMFAP